MHMLPLLKLSKETSLFVFSSNEGWRLSLPPHHSCDPSLFEGWHTSPAILDCGYKLLASSRPEGADDNVALCIYAHGYRIGDELFHQDGLFLASIRIEELFY